MSFTTTTNLSLKKPEIGGSTDLWGQYLNDNSDTLDSTINTIQTSLLSKVDNSSLGTYVTVDTTGLTQYTKTSDITLNTATDVTKTGSYTENNFLVYKSSAWTNRTKAQAQTDLLPTFGAVGTVLRVANDAQSLEFATLGFQFSYTSSTSDPSSGTNGDLFFNTTSNQLKIYNNTWVTVADTSSAALFANNNLSDLASASTARANLDVDQAGTSVAMAIALG